MTRERHECNTNGTTATRVKNFDFDNDTRKTYFHILIFTIWQVKDYKEEQFHSKNYFFETTLSLFYAKMRLKSASQKLNFLMEKATSESCTLDCSHKCPCKLPHSYAQ